MRAASAIHAAGRRALRPSSWVAVLVFGLLWNAARTLILAAPMHWEEVALPFALGACGLALAPLPWQWSGADRPMVGPLRGLLQAVPWNVAWVAAVFLLLPFHGPGEAGQGGMGNGRGRGRWATEQRVEPVPSLSPRMLALASAAYAMALVLGLLLAQKERAEGLEGEAREGQRTAQAQALQAQMNPHALFNVISALSEMARENPPALEEALVNLAALMRRLLDHASRTRAPLAEERALVEAYLAVERIRLGARLTVEWDWDAAASGREAQPMLLQPLVENAIKHGIAPSRTGGVLRIGLRGEPGRIVLRVANTGQPLEADRPEGTGLGNLRQRLDLLGAGRDSLRLVHEEGWTVAEVAIPVDRHG